MASRAVRAWRSRSVLVLEGKMYRLQSVCVKAASRNVQVKVVSGSAREMVEG